MQQFENLKVGVVGGSQGLGSWFVQFFKDSGFKVSFTSKDDSSEYTSNIELVKQSDLILLCVPISAMDETLDEIFPYLGGKILIEICSVKKFIIDKFHRLSEKNKDVNCQFYSIHPMFSNRIDGLTGQILLFTYSHNTEFQFVEKFKSLFIAQKAVWHHLDYIYHDKVMGVVQGLNHFNVFVSAKTLQETGISLDTIKNFSSPPYRIFLVYYTRYVLQNPRLYADIQIYNEYVMEVIMLFRYEMERLFEFVSKKDHEGFVNYVKDMQSFFAENKGDEEISTHLIYQLGVFMSKKDEA